MDSRRPAVALGLVLWVSGCADSPPATPPSDVPAASSPAVEAAPVVASALVNVELDGEGAGALRIPTEDGRWPLTDLVPPTLPPVAKWHVVDIESHTGTLARFRRPAELLERERLEVVVEGGKVRVEHMLTVSSTASEAAQLRAASPLRTVPELSRVVVATEKRARQSAEPRKLRTTIDGSGAGYFKPDELSGLVRQPDPCRPEHDGGWVFSELVALRHDLSQVASVTLTDRSGEQTLSLTGAQLRDTSNGHVLRIKPNKQGDWSFKELGPTPECAMVSVLRKVDQLAIETVSAK